MESVWIEITKRIVLDLNYCFNIFVCRCAIFESSLIDFSVLGMLSK